jgi:CHASE3 domain sensor protein
MRLPRRVQVLLASFLALVLLALGIDIAVLRAREQSAAELQDRLEPARLELQSLLTSLVDQETGERGFLLTGDDVFLEPYEMGRAEAAESVVALRDLIAGDDDLTATLQRVDSRIAAWQDLGADFEINARREGRDEVIASLVGAGTSRRLFDAIRTEIDVLAAQLEAAADAARDDVDRLDQLLLGVDVGTLVLALALLGFAGFLARWWFTRPLEALTRSVQAVAGGSLHSSISADGPPDFIALAADVDAMRRRILAEVDEAERAREALADRGMIVLTLREELAAGRCELPPGISLAGRFAPAQGIVAGDWFDVVRLPDDRVAVALVDVSGHGAGVGAFALRTKALTLAALETHEPGDALRWVYERLGDTGEQFLTGIIVVLDPDDGRVRYASAGHPPLLLGGLTGITELGPTGPLLGPIDATWDTHEVELTRGGVLVAYSDGLIEARDVAGSTFGVPRLVEIVERTQLGGPDAVADACLDAVQGHQSSTEDDLTLVVLAR